MNDKYITAQESVKLLNITRNRFYDRGFSEVKSVPNGRHKLYSKNALLELAKQKQETKNDYIKSGEVIKILEIAISTLYNWVKLGYIRTQRINSQIILYDKRDVLKLKDNKPNLHFGVNLKDITGQQFGKLRVVKRVENTANSRVSQWLCICDCGKEFVRNGYDLRTNSTSCGCDRIIRNYDYCWTGHEEISGKYFTSLIKSAKKREICFDITIEQIWNQFLAQNKKCNLTGEELIFVRNYGKNQLRQTASLDRINSNEPYCLNNIQWLHKDVNRLKSHFDQTYFIEMCKKVAYPSIDENVIQQKIYDQRPSSSNGERTKITEEYMIGKRFGKLVVIKKLPNIPNAMMSVWECLCDCGNVKSFFGTKLVNGTVYSCGCYRRTYKRSINWKGYGEISGSYWNKLKYANSKRKNILFTISIEDGWQKFLQQNRRCVITGETLYFTSDYDRQRHKQTASLDRIDSFGNYSIDNIQWLNKDINMLKNTFEQTKFIALCKKITDYQRFCEQTTLALTNPPLLLEH